MTYYEMVLLSQLMSHDLHDFEILLVIQKHNLCARLDFLTDRNNQVSSVLFQPTIRVSTNNS